MNPYGMGVPHEDHLKASEQPLIGQLMMEARRMVLRLPVSYWDKLAIRAANNYRSVQSETSCLLLWALDHESHICTSEDSSLDYPRTMSVREGSKEVLSSKCSSFVSSSSFDLETQSSEHAQAGGAGVKGQGQKGSKKAFRVQNSEPDFQKLWDLYRSAKIPGSANSKKSHVQWLIAVQKDSPDNIYRGLQQAIEYQQMQHKKDGWLECLPCLSRWLRDEKWLDSREASGLLTEKEREEAEYQRQCAETLRKLEAGEDVL